MSPTCGHHTTLREGIDPVPMLEANCLLLCGPREPQAALGERAGWPRRRPPSRRGRCQLATAATGRGLKPYRLPAPSRRPLWRWGPSPRQAAGARFRQAGAGRRAKTSIGFAASIRTNGVAPRW